MADAAGAGHFTLDLYTPDKRLVQAKEIEEIFVPGDRGELNVLPGHAPLMTTLQTGVLRYRLKGETKLEVVAISWGYCQIHQTGVMILAETAERPEEIDVVRVDRAMKLSSDELTKIDADADMIDKHLKKIMRAKVRKEVVGLGGGSQMTH